MEPDRIAENGPEIAWHSNWGTASDYSVPASGGTSANESWQTNDGFGGC